MQGLVSYFADKKQVWPVFRGSGSAKSYSLGWQYLTFPIGVAIMTHKKLENVKQKSYLYLIIYVYNISDVIWNSK